MLIAAAAARAAMRRRPQAAWRARSSSERAIPEVDGALQPETFQVLHPPHLDREEAQRHRGAAAHMKIRVTFDRRSAR
jgi:hypothetical protein